MAGQAQFSVLAWQVEERLVSRVMWIMTGTASEHAIFCRQRHACRVGQFAFLGSQGCIVDEGNRVVITEIRAKIASAGQAFG